MTSFAARGRSPPSLSSRWRGADRSAAASRSSGSRPSRTRASSRSHRTATSSSPRPAARCTSFPTPREPPARPQVFVRLDDAPVAGIALDGERMLLGAQFGVYELDYRPGDRDRAHAAAQDRGGPHQRDRARSPHDLGRGRRRASLRERRRVVQRLRSRTRRHARDDPAHEPRRERHDAGGDAHPQCDRAGRQPADRNAVGGRCGTRRTAARPPLRDVRSGDAARRRPRLRLAILLREPPPPPAHATAARKPCRAWCFRPMRRRSVRRSIRSIPTGRTHFPSATAAARS